MCRTSRLKFIQARRSLGVRGTVSVHWPVGGCSLPCFVPLRNRHPSRTSWATMLFISGALQYLIANGPAG